MGILIPQPDRTTSGVVLPSSEGYPELRLEWLGKYRLLRRIGQGGMSTVYQAIKEGASSTCAVKVLHPQLATNSGLVRRFVMEATMSRKLNHPNIVCGYDSAKDPASGLYYLVMEYIDGPTAHQRLEQRGRFSVADSIRIILDIARALEYLHHQGYVHRDVKPDNILLAPDGSAKLADLGVIKHPRTQKELTAFGEGIGTPYYMPWEQTISPDTVDQRSDLFALGATFYHLLTGHVPFSGDDEAAIAKAKMDDRFLPPSQHVPGLAPTVDRIIARLLAWNPKQRFASATELIDTLTASGLSQYSDQLTDAPVAAHATRQVPTRADLQSAFVDTPLDEAREQLWELRYRRTVDGSWRKLVGGTHDIVRLLESGLLPKEVLAARGTSRQFRRIRAYPEFRNIERTSMKRATPPAARNPLRSAAAKSAREATFTGWTDWIRGLCLTSLVLLLLSFSASAVLRLMTVHQ